MQTEQHAPPDQTYFTMSDVKPHITDNVLHYYDGTGTRRGWGAPSAETTIIIHSDDLIALHVGFHHKHRGGQGWFYFVNGQPKRWNQLNDVQQAQVLEFAGNAPRYAKMPGTLRTAKTQKKLIAYKVVQVVNVNDQEQFWSLYDGATEYRLGKRMTQAAKAGHQGGYYAYDLDPALLRTLTERRDILRILTAPTMKVAILQVELSGKMIAYPEHKIAATHLKPISVFAQFVIQP